MQRLSGSFCFAGALRDGVVYSAQFNNSEFVEEKMQGERKTLTQLSVPICLETLFYMLSGMVDTLMLSSVSDQAVGAVGTANTYIGVFIIMFGVISSGFVEAVALHEYQLKKVHEQGLKRSEVPPFLGLKRTDRSNDMPA